MTQRQDYTFVSRPRSAAMKTFSIRRDSTLFILGCVLKRFFFLEGLCNLQAWIRHFDFPVGLCSDHQGHEHLHQMALLSRLGVRGTSHGRDFGAKHSNH